MYIYIYLSKLRTRRDTHTQHLRDDETSSMLAAIRDACALLGDESNRSEACALVARRDHALERRRLRAEAP